MLWSRTLNMNWLARTLACLAVGAMVSVLIACGGAGNPSPTDDMATIGRGYNRGENDLEGRPDSTPREPIIQAAEVVLKKYLKGHVQVSGTPTVKILESEKSWVVSGQYDSSIDARNDFTSIVERVSKTKYEAGFLMLDDDIVLDKIRSRPTITRTPRPKPEPAPVRTWTSTSGKFSIEAAFVSKAGDKVKLKKADGTIITVEAEKLSEDDQEWIKNRAMQ